jgi:hypothetical protein
MPADLNPPTPALNSLLSAGQTSSDIDNVMFRFRVHRDFYP